MKTRRSTARSTPRWRSLAAFVTLALLPLHSFGADAAGGRFVSAQLGVSSVNNDIGSGVAFGVEGGLFPWEDWGAGAFLRAGNHSNDITSFFFGIEGLYKASLLVNGLTLGATVGSGKFTSQGLSGDSALAIGIKAAWDYHLSSQPISLGGDLSVTWCKPGDSMLTTVAPLLTAKWWF